MGLFNYFVNGSALTGEATLDGRAIEQKYVDMALEERERQTTVGFAAAEAAIDRAVEEFRTQKASEDRRSGIVDRRVGMPDSRPSGSPERRSGVDRRAQPRAFGKRPI